MEGLDECPKEWREDFKREWDLEFKDDSGNWRKANEHSQLDNIPRIGEATNTDSDSP